MDKLRKSTTNKVIFGVCGGLAEYFDTDATIIRLFTAIISIFLPVGILCYLAAALIMPKN